MFLTSLRRAAVASLAAGGLAGMHAAASADAPESVQLYGRLDASFGRYQLSGDHSASRVDSGALGESFLGFSGSEDLGGGIKVKFALEHDVQVDTGNGGRYTGATFFDRTAYVGLAGAFGSTLLGRNMTPLYLATRRYNAFGESYAYSPSLRLLFTPNAARGMAPFIGDSAWDNSFVYSSPDQGEGFSYRLIGGLGEHASGAKGRNLGADISYDAGPFSATVVYERVRNGLGTAAGSPLSAAAPEGFELQRVFQLSASYDLNVVKFYGQYGQVRIDADDNARTTLYQLGAAAPLGRGDVLLQFGSAKAELKYTDNTDRSVSLGYDYHLSKRTGLYAIYSYDKLTGYSSGNSLVGGMHLSF